MEDESPNEMDSNQPISSHHPTHHQHHLDIPLNDSKKRSNNHNPVDDCRNNILCIIPHLFSRRFRLVIIIHRYQWSMNWINRILNNKIIYQVCYSICSRKNILSETFLIKYMEQVELMRHRRHHLNQPIPLKVLRVNLVRVQMRH